jgi:hypothetical protein
MDYDFHRHVAVLFGGSCGDTHFNDTWEWDGSEWSPKPASGPAVRTAHDVAYDRLRGELVLFGGQQSPGGPFLDDTWTYLADCNANGIGDGLDIASGGSSDCNENDVPDECDIAFGGESLDCNGNGVPDECEYPCIADLNCDGTVDLTDFTIFAAAYGKSCSQEP